MYIWSFTDEPVCPYCDVRQIEYDDALAHPHEEVILTCEECGKDFICLTNVETTFSTKESDTDETP